MWFKVWLLNLLIVVELQFPCSCWTCLFCALDAPLRILTTLCFVGLHSKKDLHSFLFWLSDLWNRNYTFFKKKNKKKINKEGFWEFLQLVDPLNGIFADLSINFLKFPYLTLCVHELYLNWYFIFSGFNDS